MQVSTLDFLWLATGTIFYTALNGDELTFSEAIFLATNVGLGVGYGNVLPESMATMYVGVRVCHVLASGMVWCGAASRNVCRCVAETVGSRWPLRSWGRPWWSVACLFW